MQKKKRQVQLYDYQKDGIRMIDGFAGRCVLADEMGLGKSVQAFGWGHWKLKEGQATVIVCPATLKPHWQRECKTHFGRMALVLDGRVPDRAALRVPWARPVFIVNYDILGQRKLDNSWAEVIRQEVNVGLVIGDECHRLSNPRNICTKAFRHLVQDVPHLIAISGTPMTNQPTELWSVLNMIDPAEFPSFNRFAARYSVPNFTPWGVQYKGGRRLKELNLILKDKYMVRRLKADVLKELPPKRRMLVPLQLSKADWKEYQTIEQDFVRWMERTYPERAAKARKAERLVKFNYLKSTIGRLKRPHVEGLLRDMVGERKVIVFTSYKETCEQLYQAFKPNSVKVDGSIPPGPKRQAMIDRFRHDAGCRVFVGNLKAAGVGWDGTMTDTVLFAEFGWTPGEHTQAEDRPHRIGQKGSVQCIYPYVPGTLEEKLLQIIQDKQKSLDGALDGLSDGEGEFRILDLLEKSMKGR